MPERRSEPFDAVLAAAFAQLGSHRLAEISQGRERGMLLPAVDEGLDAFALRHRRQRLVLELAAGALVRIGDSRRPAFEDQGADPVGNPQRVPQRESRAHGVTGEEERIGSERGGQGVERVVPTRRVRTRSVSGKIGSEDAETRLERIAEMIERPPRPGEAVEERESGNQGALPRAEATAASSARCRSTLRARSERTWTKWSPPVSRRAARNSGSVRGECKRAPASAAARARSRPCGLPNSSSERGVCEAMGRKEKMPPPALSPTTNVSSAPSQAAATRPPRSGRKARSPSSTAVRREVASAAPRALATMPSMPFTPRLARTRTAAARPAQASTSRTGMLLETKSCDPAGNAARSSRATAGSDGSSSRAKAASSPERAR